MHVLRWRILLAVCVAMRAFPGFGGAFLQPEGHGQAIVTTTFSDATKAYDASGRLIQGPSYGKFETRAYVEYGALDWLTLVAEPSYMKFHGASRGSSADQLDVLIAEAKAGQPLLLPSAPAGADYTGFGAGALGARALLFEFDSFILSLEASLRAAPPAARRFLDMRSAVQEDVRLQLGAPWEFFGLEGFGDAQLGYRSRGQGGSEFRADLTWGLRPFERTLLLAQSFTAVAPDRYRFTASQKLQLSVAYEITENVALQIGGLVAVLGVNASAERGVLTAAWYRF